MLLNYCVWEHNVFSPREWSFGQCRVSSSILYLIVDKLEGNGVIVVAVFEVVVLAGLTYPK